MTVKYGEKVTIVAEDGFEFTIEFSELTPELIWKNKDDWTARQEKSITEWNKMTEETKAAVLDIVERSLDRVKDRVDAWVPTSLELQQGQYLDVSFRIVFTELEQETLAKEQITKRRIASAADELRELIAPEVSDGSS